MIAPEYFNNHVAVEGEIIVKSVPNDAGFVLVWNPTTKKISRRTHTELISDLNLVTSNQLGNYWQKYDDGSFRGINDDDGRNFSFVTNNGASAKKINTGGLLTSNAYSDEQYIPANGIYSKGNIATLNYGSAIDWAIAYNWTQTQGATMNWVNANFVTLNTEQNIEGAKWFKTIGGNQYLNHRLRIISEDGSNPGMVFYKAGVNVGTIQYDGSNYLFTTSNTNAFTNLVSAGYIKEGSNDGYLLLGGGGHMPVSSFASGNYTSYQDNREINPSEMEPKKIGYGFTTWDNNNNSPYADYLHFGGYQDDSGGRQNLIVFRKNGFGIRQWQGEHQSINNYSDYVDYWHTGSLPNPVDQSQLSGYLPLSGGTLTGDGRIDSYGSITLQQTAVGSNATGIWWEKLDDSDKIGGIGAFTTNGEFGFAYMGWGAYPWSETTNLAVGEDIFAYKTNQVWHAGILPDYRNYGLGRSNEGSTNYNLNNITETSILGINNTTTSTPSGLEYGSVWTHRKNPFEFTQIAVDVITGQSYTRGWSTGFGDTGWRKHWDNVNLQNPVDQSQLSNYVTLNTPQTITAHKTFAGATGNDYIGSALMVNGDGATNTIFPTIAFHQPGLYAGTVSYRDNEFYFMNVNGNGFNYVRTAGFIKADSHDGFVLLGGGGHKPFSDFATSVDLNNYVTIHTPQTIIADKTFAPSSQVSFLGNEENQVDVWKTSSGINTIVSGHVYHFYNTRWKVGSKRSDGAYSEGYAFQFSSNGGATYDERVLITFDGNILTSAYGAASDWNAKVSQSQLANYLPLSGGTLTGTLNALTISAQNGADKLIYDNIENFGSTLKINANASLGIQLQSNNNTKVLIDEGGISLYGNVNTTGSLNINSNSEIGRWKGADNNTNYLIWRNYSDTKDIAYIGADGNSAATGGVGDGFAIVAPSGRLQLNAQEGVLINGNAPWTAGNFNPDTKVNKSGDTMIGALLIGNNNIGKQRVLHLAEPTYLDSYGFNFYTDTSTGSLTLHGLNNGLNNAAPILSANRANNFVGINKENATTELDVNGNITSNGFIKNNSSDDYFLMGGGGQLTKYSKDDSYVNSHRDFPDGTLITTNIDYSHSAGDSFLLEIKGNMYGGGLPMDTKVQGYIYADTIINQSGYSTYADLSTIIAMNINGNLCFWFPRLWYWQGFSVKVIATGGGGITTVNRVISIDNSAEPVGTKQVKIAVYTLSTQSWVNNQGFLTSANLNGYVTQSALNTQLGSYATLNGVQTFNNTNTFNQSPVIPNGTLGTHAVNLNQLLDVAPPYHWNYVGQPAITNRRVLREMTWNNYGNGHTIFDISSGTTPWGTSKSNVDAEQKWTPSYPTLVGGNGSETYGVRVDSARNADNLGGIPAGNYATQAWVNTNFIPTSHPVYNITQANINSWNAAAGGGSSHTHFNLSYLNNIDQYLGTGQAPQFGSIRLMDSLGYGLLALGEDFIGGEVGLVDLSNDRFYAGRINEYLKYGSSVNGFEGLNIHFDAKLLGIGREIGNDEDKVQLAGDLSVDTVDFDHNSRQLVLNPLYNADGDVRRSRNAHIYIVTRNPVRLPDKPILGQRIEIFNDSDSDIEVTHGNVGTMFKVPAFCKITGIAANKGFRFDAEPIRTKQYDI